MLSFPIAISCYPLWVLSCCKHLPPLRATYQPVPKQIEQAARSPYSHRCKLIYHLPPIYSEIYVAKVARKRTNWRVKIHRHLTWLLTALDLRCFLGRCFFLLLCLNSCKFFFYQTFLCIGLIRNIENATSKGWFQQTQGPYDSICLLYADLSSRTQK